MFKASGVAMPPFCANKDIDRTTAPIRRTGLQNISIVIGNYYKSSISAKENPS
jgi:hypothetical protein